jgi:hypothetical protein
MYANIANVKKKNSPKAFAEVENYEKVVIKNVISVENIILDEHLRSV